jgi:twitching motility protein PilI
MIGNPDFFPGNGQNLGSDISTLANPEGELHLRFFLSSGEEFAIPATGIAEVLQQPPERITPIPNTSPLLLGTINLRGQIIWVADLGQFFGDKSVLNTDRSEIPVIAIEDRETFLGLAVERLGEMDWLDIERLQNATHIRDDMAPFIQGQWNLNQENNQLLKLLDCVAILRSARWAA